MSSLRVKQSLVGKLNNAIVHEYPELEDLTVTPSMEEQHFKSEKYGYDNVIVRAIESKELNIIPSSTEQVEEGIFNKVTVAGDSALSPENVKKDVEIFGVVGDFIGTDTSDATAIASEVLESKIAYVKGEKITGTMPNNGALNYNPSDEVQTIPAGYTSGGTITALDITKLSDYENCLALSNEILGKTYEYLDYLAITSSAILKLGMTIDTSYTYKLKLKDTNTTQWECYVGCDSAEVYFCRNNNNGYFNSKNITYDVTSIPSQPTEVSLNFTSGQGKNIVIGTTYNTTAKNATFDLYYLQIYNSTGELIHNLKPAQEKSTGNIGLLDEVTKNFIVYGN